MAMNNLTAIVGSTSETSDQNSDNLAVVDTVLSETAALLSATSTSLDIKYVKEVNNTGMYIIITLGTHLSSYYEFNYITPTSNI